MKAEKCCKAVEWVLAMHGFCCYGVSEVHGVPGGSRFGTVCRCQFPPFTLLLSSDVLELSGCVH